jgi:DNA-binding MarR family transcriptional regulator
LKKAMPPSSVTTRADELLGLASGLRLVVMRLARRLRQRAEAGITPSMLSALSSVERLGPITLGDLAAAERVRPPSLTAIVSRLEEEGLVARHAAPDDGRVAMVTLTGSGVRLMERNRSRKNAYLAQRLRTLDRSDREVLSRALGILERVLQDEP